MFGATIAGIRAFSSAPLLIAETAVGTTPNRESQIDALFAGVRAERLAGVVWFDEAQHAGLYHQDWRLEHDPSALAAFTAAVAYLPARERLACLRHWSLPGWSPRRSAPPLFSCRPGI